VVQNAVSPFDNQDESHHEQVSLKLYFSPTTMNFPNLGGLNIGELMSKVQQAQQQMESMKNDLKHRTVTGDAGGGMVTATANGAQELVALKFDPVILTDPQMAQDLIIAAVNKALDASRELAEEEVKKLTSFLPNIPGMQL
jgi:DNA-binding YbaB/EbfC family protein